MSWRTLILTKPEQCSGEESDCRNKAKITEIEKEMQRVDLLPGAHRRDNQLAGATLLAVALVMLVEQREGAIGGRSRAGKFRSQSLIRPANLVIPLRRHWAALVNRGCDNLKIVGQLPEHLAVGGFLHILVGKAGNLLVAVEHDSQTIAAGSVLQKPVNPASAPERNDVGLRDQQHGIR